MKGKCRDNEGDMKGKSNGEVPGNARTRRGQEAEGAMWADQIYACSLVLPGFARLGLEICRGTNRKRALPQMDSKRLVHQITNVRCSPFTVTSKEKGRHFQNRPNATS